MSELITVEKFNAISFYQIPQAFYYHPKYKGMSASARETYAILRNLLSLSIQNGWVNDKGEIYVKISREKLMLRLGIKKDKMSNVFKELRVYELIEEKRVGCNKCNEIYLCHAKELSAVYKEADLLQMEEEEETHQGGRENRDLEGEKTEIQIAEKTPYNKTQFKKNEDEKMNTLPPLAANQEHETLVSEEYQSLVSEEYRSLVSEKDQFLISEQHSSLINKEHQPLVDQEVLIEFEKAFATSRISIKAKEVMVMFLRHFEKSVVLYAFDLAGSKNKSFDYAQGILRKWWQAGAFTFDAVFAYEQNLEKVC